MLNLVRLLLLRQLLLVPLVVTVNDIGAFSFSGWKSVRTFATSSSFDGEAKDGMSNDEARKTSTYNLGVGKNRPVGSNDGDIGSRSINAKTDIHWNVPEYPNAASQREVEIHVNSKNIANDDHSGNIIDKGNVSTSIEDKVRPRRVRRMVPRAEETSTLRGAIWHEEHYSVDDERKEYISSSSTLPPDARAGAKPSSLLRNTTFDTTLPTRTNGDEGKGPIKKPELFYPNIDLSIPLSVYDPETSRDIVWDLMRWDAYQEAQREPLLVSFLYSSILNHDSLESSLAFLLSNKLSSVAMISTQIQSLILDALNKDRSIGRSIRADIMVRGPNRGLG